MENPYTIGENKVQIILYICDIYFLSFFLMSMLKEFKEFAMKGNVVDLAV